MVSFGGADIIASPLTLSAFITLVLTALPGGIIAALIRYVIMPSQR